MTSSELDEGLLTDPPAEPSGTPPAAPLPAIEAGRLSPAAAGFFAILFALFAVLMAWCAVQIWKQRTGGAS